MGAEKAVFVTISEIEQIPERIPCFPSAACSSAGGGFLYRLRYTFYFVDILLLVISLAIECRKEELLNTSSKPGLNKEKNDIPTIVDENSEHCDKDKPSDGADHNHRYNTLILVSRYEAGERYRHHCKKLPSYILDFPIAFTSHRRIATFSSNVGVTFKFCHGSSKVTKNGVDRYITKRLTIPSTALYLVPLSSYLTLNTIVILKCRLGVNQSQSNC